MPDIIPQYFLLWSRPEFLFIFLIFGYLFIDQQAFRKTIILLLFTCIIGSLLKSIWKVPLNPHDANSWWAYPSGHTQVCVVIWLTLFYQLPRKWLIIKKWIVLPIGLYFMVDVGYHDWPEVFGGICSGIIISSFYILWLMKENKNELYFKIAMMISSGFIYAYMALSYKFDFSWMAKLLGLMIAASLVDHKRDLFIKHISPIKKMIIFIITFCCAFLLAKYVSPTELKHLIKFVYGLLLGLTFFFALPNLLCGKGSIPLDKR